MSQALLDQLALSWRTNAQAWTAAVRAGQIESRRLATDAAITQAILAGRPRRVLDVGCGEGWLCRALAAQGIETVGTDASAPLIDAARAAGGADYHLLSYAELPAAAAQLGRFDVVACNFALLDEKLDGWLAGLHALLHPPGTLVIQTVHPWTARGDGEYRDGWRSESFAGFGAGFTEAMPWYYRTLESWIAALNDAGWAIRSLAEPRHPHTGVPISLLISAAPKAT